MLAHIQTRDSWFLSPIRRLRATEPARLRELIVELVCILKLAFQDAAISG